MVFLPPDNTFDDTANAYRSDPWICVTSSFCNLIMLIYWQEDDSSGQVL